MMTPRAAKKSWKSSLEDLPELVEKINLALIYFAGHGQTEILKRGVKHGYILPSDADSRLVASAISMVELRDVAQRLDSKHMLFMMDSCYAGTAFTTDRGMREKSDFDPTTRNVVQMMTTGMSGDPAREEDGQGLFTTQLIAGLSGRADKDGDGFAL